MKQTALFLLPFALLIEACWGIAAASDYRLDPDAANRGELSIMPAKGFLVTVRAGRISELDPGKLYPDKQDVMQAYAGAMTWYRLAPEDAYPKGQTLALDWVGSDQLPEPFRLAWAAPNGDLVARIGGGIFRIILGDYRHNWFRDIDCRMVSWPDKNLEAAMSCDDGQERKMLIPGGGTVIVDGVSYAQVFPGP